MSQNHEITSLRKRLEAQGKQIDDQRARLVRSENNRAEWERRANIAENERDALKALLYHEQPTVAQVAPAPVEEHHAPDWLSPTLTWIGAFLIIAAAIPFFVLELWQVSDAWFLLAVVTMAGIALLAVGRRISCV
jgi:hypothetical protein